MDLQVMGIVHADDGGCRDGFSRRDATPWKGSFAVVIFNPNAAHGKAFLESVVGSNLDGEIRFEVDGALEPKTHVAQDRSQIARFFPKSQDVVKTHGLAKGFIFLNLQPMRPARNRKVKSSNRKS
jgi:hypothetical protein